MDDFGDVAGSAFGVRAFGYIRVHAMLWDIVRARRVCVCVCVARVVRVARRRGCEERARRPTTDEKHAKKYSSRTQARL